MDKRIWHFFRDTQHIQEKRWHPHCRPWRKSPRTSGCLPNSGLRPMVRTVRMSGEAFPRSTGDPMSRPRKHPLGDARSQAPSTWPIWKHPLFHRGTLKLDATMATSTAKPWSHGGFDEDYRGCGASDLGQDISQEPQPILAYSIQACINESRHVLSIIFRPQTLNSSMPLE